MKSFASGLRKKNHNHNSPRKVMVGEFNSDSICENKTKRFLTRRFENWIFTRKLRLPCLLFTLKRNILYLLYLLPFHHIKYLKITDYFSQDCRVECNFADLISPLEYFRLNKEAIIANLGEKPTNTRCSTLFKHHH